MYQFELAGSVTEHAYKESIPDECSMTTLKQHQEMMLCWGLVRAIEKGHKMDCSRCDWNKVNFAAWEQRAKERKEKKAAT